MFLKHSDALIRNCRKPDSEGIKVLIRISKNISGCWCWVPCYGIHWICS